MDKKQTQRRDLDQHDCEDLPLTATVTGETQTRTWLNHDFHDSKAKEKF